MVGSYDPRADRVELKADRILNWLKNGAQASGTVHNLLVSQKIIDAKKINILPKKTVAKVEATPAETPAAPAEVAPAPAEEAPITTPEETPAAAEDNAVAQEVPAE